MKQMYSFVLNLIINVCLIFPVSASESLTRNACSLSLGNTDEIVTFYVRRTATDGSGPHPILYTGSIESVTDAATDEGTNGGISKYSLQFAQRQDTPDVPRGTYTILRTEVLWETFQDSKARQAFIARWERSRRLGHAVRFRMFAPLDGREEWVQGFPELNPEPRGISPTAQMNATVRFVDDHDPKGSVDIPLYRIDLSSFQSLPPTTLPLWEFQLHSMVSTLNHLVTERRINARKGALTQPISLMHRDPVGGLTLVVGRVLEVRSRTDGEPVVILAESEAKESTRRVIPLRDIQPHSIRSSYSTVPDDAAYDEAAALLRRAKSNGEFVYLPLLDRQVLSGKVYQVEPTDDGDFTVGIMTDSGNAKKFLLSDVMLEYIFTHRFPETVSLSTLSQSLLHQLEVAQRQRAVISTGDLPLKPESPQGRGQVQRIFQTSTGGIRAVLQTTDGRQILLDLP